MEMHPLEDFEELEGKYVSDVPEDLATPYAWADLEGAPPRDSSADCREQRARMRHRAAKQIQLNELRAQSESRVAARAAEPEVLSAHAEADAAAKLASESGRTMAFDRHAWKDSEGLRRGADDLDEEAAPASPWIGAHQASEAVLDIELAAGRAQAALAEFRAEQQKQQIGDGRPSAKRDTERHLDAGLCGGSTAFNPKTDLPCATEDPYPSRWFHRDDGLIADYHSLSKTVGEAYRELEGAVCGLALQEKADGRDEDTRPAPATIARMTVPWTMDESMRETPPAGAARNAAVEMTAVSATRPDAASERKAQSGVKVVKRILRMDEVGGVARAEASMPDRALRPGSLFEVTEHAMSELFEADPVSEIERAGEVRSGDDFELHRAPEIAGGSGDVLKHSRAKRPASWGADVPGPAWLYPRQHASGMRSLGIFQASGDVPESLDHSKERIAARWFALRSVFARHDADRSSERVAANPKSRQAPIVAVFSIAGGAGKTSLVATLGRALSSLGERVLLSDTTSHGLLPFYFGASQLVSGVVRTFSPPAGSTDAPIHLVSYDLVSYDAVRESEEAEGQEGIVDDLLENSQRANRVLLDLSVNSARMVGLLAQFKPTILIPLMPDMNSVISIDVVEKLFSSMLDAEGRPLQPVYLLNQFDAALPLHLDIREVLKQQLGERLMPFVIRRSAAVGEALAEGMTIVDYEPGSPAVEDYTRVANWLRSVSAPEPVAFRNQRWSEQ